MEQETLRGWKRTESGTRPARRLRRTGRVPAVVYGTDLDPTPIAVDGRELYRVLHTEAGLNALINVDVEGGGSVLTVAREVQRHPVRGEITHLDFIKVSLDVAIEAEVGLEFTGEAIGVKDEGGILETIANTVQIEALPTAIPSHIQIDVSGLNIGDVLTVSDLPVIDGVTYLDDPDRPLVTVSIPAAVEAEAAVAEVEGEEGVEGEEAVPVAEEAPAEGGE